MGDISEEYLSNIYKDVIMDHFRNPRNGVDITEYDYFAEEINPFCGDKVSFKVKLTEDRIISNVSAIADGCTVIKASSSLLSVFVNQSKIDDLPPVISRFENFLKNGDDLANNFDLGILSELGVVRQHPVRLKCVLLPVRALNNIIDQI
ncbi:MAG: iron-sulfur cluster assembly scaffold protein [Dehalococcoidia bacterium]